MRHSPTGSARSGRRQATLTVSVRTARRSNGSSLPLNDNRARTSDVNPIIFSWHMAFGVQVSDPRWELAGRLVPERQGRIGFQLIYDWRSVVGWPQRAQRPFGSVSPPQCAEGVPPPNVHFRAAE